MATGLGKAFYFVTHVKGIWGLPLLFLGVSNSARLSFDSSEFSRVWISNPGSVHRGRVDLSLDRHAVSFRLGGRKVRLAYDTLFQLRENVRSIVGIFYNGLYDFRGLRGTVLFDVGASVGDSTVYLAPHARRIYAIEPYPYSYSLLLRNIKLNGLSRKVRAVNAAISDKQGEVSLTTKRVSGITAFLDRWSGGKKVRVMTLAQMTATHRGPGRLSLKLNCLGYENRIILNSSPKDLRRFSNILVYTMFSDCKALESRLRNEGFATNVSKDKGARQALIFATRR